MTKTTTSAPLDPDAARQQLADAEDQAARLRAQLQAHTAEQAVARERRLTEFDQAALAQLAQRVETARAEEAAAAEEFRAAVIADAVFGAYVRHRAARHARAQAADQLGQTHRRLGQEPPRQPLQGGVDNNLLADLVKIVEAEGRRLAADELDKFHQRRDAAGDGVTS
ncbi:hypothetical protein [Modestobacter sp. VKM Ac-2978]|uniref:hypothetical protein n=1 Tax=Modestobacter sp. VKM Ac-2978 TaxID=3004132 RepID=UPI0022AA952F|nr:hypothetical protein [Modestobacter sp. VKM Ac-2978]MCZ2850009.1 hypothetical protein [Modestobacter sp. VKM Ac-2978]